jgi:hypothetical protein
LETKTHGNENQTDAKIEPKNDPIDAKTSRNADR